MQEQEFSVALRAVLATAWLFPMTSCVTPGGSQSLDGSKFLRDQLVVNSDVALAPDEPVVQGLLQLRGDLAALLQLTTSEEPIYVYLFEDEAEFTALIERQYPELHGRRAIFVKNADGLTVYARWTERVDEDLRHEVAHGYLHSVLPHVPLWLDEGVAEYFENPPAEMGRNQAHIDLLSAARHRWSPDLMQLERLTEASQMDQLDYAEAWLWIHFCLNTTAERRVTLLQYVGSLQAGRATQTFHEMIGLAEQELKQHLERLSRPRDS